MPPSDLLLVCSSMHCSVMSDTRICPFWKSRPRDRADTQEFGSHVAMTSSIEYLTEREATKTSCMSNHLPQASDNYQESQDFPLGSVLSFYTMEDEAKGSRLSCLVWHSGVQKRKRRPSQKSSSTELCNRVHKSVSVFSFLFPTATTLPFTVLFTL